MIQGFWKLSCPFYIKSLELCVYPPVEDMRKNMEKIKVYDQILEKYDINVKREEEKRIERNVLPFYVKGLQKLQKIMQMPADFRFHQYGRHGYFSPSLKNEYALIACALEKVRDKKDQSIYSRSMN